MNASRTSRITNGEQDEEQDNAIIENRVEPVAVPFDGPFDFEVVGLQMTSNGRQCCSHDACGQNLSIGDVVKLVPTIVTTEDKDESPLAVQKIVDGTVGCRP